MKLAGTTALVTGANRGLGRAFVEALRGAGCARIYAGARNAAGIAGDGIVVPIKLDITREDEVAAAASRCTVRALRSVTLAAAPHRVSPAQALRI